MASAAKAARGPACTRSCRQRGQATASERQPKPADCRS
jgi:hypothetical protein